jgi:hypothetical protein
MRLGLRRLTTTAGRSGFAARRLLSTADIVYPGAPAPVTTKIEFDVPPKEPLPMYRVIDDQGNFLNKDYKIPVRGMNSLFTPNTHVGFLLNVFCFINRLIMTR